MRTACHTADRVTDLTMSRAVDSGLPACTAGRSTGSLAIEIKGFANFDGGAK